MSDSPIAPEKPLSPGIIDINIYVIPQMRFVPQTFYPDI
jgi:hypothetical protein